jgi:hypothetical protein
MSTRAYTDVADTLRRFDPNTPSRGLHGISIRDVSESIKTGDMALLQAAIKPRRMEKRATDAPRGVLLVVANGRRHCCGAHRAPHQLWRVVCIHYAIEQRMHLRASALASALAIALATYIRWQRGVCALFATLQAAIIPRRMEKAAKDAPRGVPLVANERRHCCGAHGAPHRLWRVACIHYDLGERMRLRASALASTLAIALATYIRWQRGVCALFATASSLALALAIALVGQPQANSEERHWHMHTMSYYPLETEFPT